MAVKLRDVEYEDGSTEVEIKCFNCGCWLPILEDRKGRYYFACNVCHYICFVHEGRLKDKIDGEEE